MRQKAWTWTAPLDRARRHRGLRKGFAARTHHARPHDAVHDEPPGNVFQFFGHILAQTAQLAAALGAVVVAGGQLDFHAWDVIGDRPAFGLVPKIMGGRLIGKTQLCRHLGDSDLACFQRQLKLFDTLGRCAEPSGAMACQLMSKPLDQDGLGLHLGQQKRCELSQFFRIFRQGFGHVQHAYL